MLRKLLKILETFSLPTVPRRILVLLWISGIAVFVGVLALILQDKIIAVLEPRGEIAARQRDLLYFAVGLSLLVLIPTYFMLYSFAWRYRSGHKKQYWPKWDGNTKLETIWWGVPIVIIAVLAVVTWTTSHSLNPSKPLAGTREALKVQVIAMQWKWLFIYPEQGIASVNRLAIPTDTPVELSITSDAPMNSFWIPQLGGQIYAMAGMATKLNINATSTGDYRGMSANLSGAGFADMTFTASAKSESGFREWARNIRTSESSRVLTASEYKTLSRPDSSPEITYRVGDDTIFENAIMKYMGDDEHVAQYGQTHAEMEHQ